MTVCETPGRSLAAAVGGGLVGGGAGLALGLDTAGVAALAGAVGGAADVGTHLLWRDAQFRDAVGRVRARLGRPTGDGA